MPSIIKQIIEKSDLIRLAHEYGITLKKTGVNFKARCPFHIEKTPSFFINPLKNVYHCFGCGKSGNVVTFVSEIEKIPVQDAVRKLAKIYGINYEYTGERREENSTDVMYEFAKFLNEILKKKEGKTAYEYLEQRGIKKETMDLYMIGYAPFEVKIYDKFLHRKDILNILISCGIFGCEGNNVFPLLKDRVVFPIFDVFGRIVAFGGRNLEDKSNSPKYLNTRENKWFEKRNIFYAHPNYTNDLSKNNSAIVVEGYFDQILLNQAGFHNTISILGSAFSTNHVHFLEKYVKKVYFYFDEDEAGLKSVLSTLDMVLNANFEAYYVTTNTGLDPSDIVVKFGKGKIQDCLKNAITLIEYYFGYIKNKFVGTTNLEEKAQYLEEALKKISCVTNQIRRELILSQFGEFIGFNIKTLEERLSSIIKSSTTTYNVLYALQNEKENNRALYELEAEIIYIIAKDVSLRNKSYELKIDNYIITPFFKDLYEKVVSNNESVDLMTIIEPDEKYNKYLPYLCKFEYMSDYDITAERLIEVFNNLKNMYIKNKIAHENIQLEKTIELKKEIFELLS